MKADEAHATITNDVTFYPIARKIDGYVYQNGKIVPNAKVTVTLEDKNKPFYTTTASENGYLHIPSDKLPLFPYSLTVNVPGQTAVKQITTDSFAKDNQTYLNGNNINLMVSESAAANEAANNANNSSVNGQANNPQNGTSNQNQKTEGITQANPLLVVLILIIMLGVVAAMLVLYLRKKKNAPLPEDPVPPRKNKLS